MYHFFLLALPDPSLSGGYSIIFEGEIPIKIKNYNADGTINIIQPTVQTNLIPEMITVRILTNNIFSVRMELSNEVRLHLHLIAVSTIKYAEKYVTFRQICFSIIVIQSM